MIVSHAWLKQFVPHDLSADTVGELLSRHCVTLDGIARLGAELEAFVVGQVVEAARHPNSERLWVTKVDDGSGTLQDVVCGAPNVVAGHKYPFARTGTVMPGGMKIEKRKIRGETSNGMLCSPTELGLGMDADGIMTLDTDAAPGTALLDVLSIADSQLTLDVLPNRPDLLSHRGVAREISAITGVPWTRDPQSDGGVELPSADAMMPASGAADGVSIHVHDNVSCPLYVAVVVKGVTVGPSPAWLRARLESIGQRSINNVVDATNYILQAFGQPVHAFDLARLTGARIDVRPTREGESLVTLDGVSRSLPTGTTVICDGERPVALAGVMGGRDSEVTAATTDILLEVAVFDPRFVRKVRRAVNLSTDASYRFERGVDADAVPDIAAFGAALIASVAGGQPGALMGVGSATTSRALVPVRPLRLAQIVGVTVPVAEITARLESIGCTVQPEHDPSELLQVTPPSWRHDLLLEVDLIEEVVRLMGFDSLPDELRPFRPGNAPDHPLYVSGRRVRDALVAAGLAETRPMPFTSRGDESTPRVRNPLAEDEPFLRSSVVETLARRAEYNLSRMQGNIRLFEIGNTFRASSGRLPVEEMRAGALIMGARRPPHFTEPQPPAFDEWDAKALAETIVAAAFPREPLTFVVGEGDTLWTLQVAGRGVVGRVERVVLDRPVWAAPAFGVELTLGVLFSDDVAGLQAQSHRTPETAPATTVAIRARPLPTTPAAEFDLALVVPDHMHAATVEDALRATGGDLLERVTLFDEFRGTGIPEGHRSLAWRLTFRHPERTLRDKEIEGRRARLLETLDKELGIRTRAS